jgi:hypothetical protein
MAPPDPACCADPSCRRKTPILLRRGAFDNRWYVITKYTRTGGTVRSIEKHLLDDETQAALSLAFGDGLTTDPDGDI